MLCNFSYIMKCIKVHKETFQGMIGLVNVETDILAIQSRVKNSVSLISLSPTWWNSKN